MFRFIHAADIHLDSPMRGLPDYEGAPIDEIRGATRRALEAMVDLAIEEEASFVLIVGDLYDGDWPDFNTGLFFAGEMTRLREARIPVIIASGNHDAASQITKTLRLPDSVRSLSTTAPQTIRMDNVGVAIHGQGFAERHVTANVVPGYPNADPGLFNIGMLHTSAGRGGHDEYAPCAVQDLVDRGYQYWALGHIHKAEIVRDDPWICFPGNLQGRHIRETGPKGCLLVTVDDGETGFEPRCLEVVRWETCDVSSEGCRDAHDVLERTRSRLGQLLDASESEVLATRIAVSGDSPALAQLLSDPARWTNEVRQQANDVGVGRIWVEKLTVQPSEFGETEPGDAQIDDLALSILRSQELTSTDVAALGANVVQSLTKKLPLELLGGDESLEWCEALVERLAPRARALLFEALQGTAGGDAE